ncbi:MAG: hypothetical protein WDA03_04480 [Trueperaceae bacterium]
MYRVERQPAWQRDVAWASAVLLALAALAGVLWFSLAQLSDRETGQATQREILRLTLRPGGNGGLVEVRTGAGFVPGQQLMLLPGMQVFADPTEIPTFTVSDAVSRSAGVLADRLVVGGQDALLGMLSNESLRRQFQLALSGPVPALVTAAIDGAMQGGGLDDGTRAADWPTQAATNPGQPVQPLVGVFVTFPVNQVQNMSPRQVGVAIMQELTENVLQGGLQQALALITNDNLRARLTSGVDTTARALLHELFSALLTASEAEMEARLVEAKAVVAGVEEDSDALVGLLPAAELAGLAPEQAEERVLSALAERAWSGGGALAAAQLTRPEHVERVTEASPILDLFSARAHGRFLTWSWLAGLAALLFTVLLVGFSRGMLRLVNPGLALVIGAGLGALAFYRLDTKLPDMTALPVGAAAQGVFVALGDLFAHAVRSLPAEVVQLPLRNYVIVGGFGAALVLLALVLWLLNGVRPRRRSFR